MSAETATDWSKPRDLDDVDMAFPAHALDFMPPRAEIPDEFKSDSNPWVEWQGRWFFRGLAEFPRAKTGINQEHAERHLKAIQGSFAPKHEHKMAAVAYLASLWLVEPTK